MTHQRERQLELLDPGPDVTRCGDVDPLQLTPRGSTYEPGLDLERLGRQLRAVLDLMSDGVWRTLPELAQQVVGAETALSARLRDLRRLGYRVERRRRGDAKRGLFEYSLVRGGR